MIRWDKGEERERLSDMWQRIFHDTRPYIKFYFDQVYGKNEVLLEENEDGIRGMLHLNPYILQAGGSDLAELPAHYIVGVSTEEDYRRQGIMRSLLLESFRSLRERGEAFTYLMPADPAYYLPFSFRYGMKQYEQELALDQAVRPQARYAYYRSSETGTAEYADAEQAYNAETYALASKVDESYLSRQEKEVSSEFGCLFYVKKYDEDRQQERPAGRFVVYAEDDCLSISSLVCYDREERELFLREMIAFCDNRYHFRQYRILYPEDWQTDLLKPASLDKMRLFYTRELPVIMFRILDLVSMGALLRADEEISCRLYVTDTELPEQEGAYEIHGGVNGLEINRLSEDVRVDGSIDIADLTARIFGDLDHSAEQLPAGFNEAAGLFWRKLRAIRPIQIPDIV